MSDVQVEAPGGAAVAVFAIRGVHQLAIRWKGDESLHVDYWIGQQPPLGADEAFILKMDPRGEKVRIDYQRSPVKLHDEQ